MKHHPMSSTAWVLPSTEPPRWPEHVPRAVLGGHALVLIWEPPWAVEATHSHQKPELAQCSWIPAQPPPDLPIHSLLIVLTEKKGPTTYLRGGTLRVT